MEPVSLIPDDRGAHALRLENAGEPLTREPTRVLPTGNQRAPFTAAARPAARGQVDRRGNERRRRERRSRLADVYLDTRLARERRRVVRRHEDMHMVTVYANGEAAREIGAPQAIAHRGVDVAV